MALNMLSGKWWTFCLSLNMLNKELEDRDYLYIIAVSAGSYACTVHPGRQRWLSNI